MQHKTLRGNLLLIVAAVIWGSAFVAQSEGMAYVGPFSFGAVRYIIGGVVLIPFAWFFSRNDENKDVRGTIFGGIMCGLALFLASTLQQIGIQYTTVAKSGFLTAMYIVLVPILRIVLGKRPTFRVWLCILVAAVGVYFLCAMDGFSINIGDGLMILSALMFSVHICVIDHFVEKHSGVWLACIQFLVVGLVSTPFMFIFEAPTIADISNAWVEILYTAVFSSGIAYTFQILGQRDTNPVVASLIMSTESLFAALSGWVILGQAMTVRELFGSLLMISAIVFAQLPEKKKEKVNT